MSLSPANREVENRRGSSGKDLNPDRGDSSSSAPGASAPSPVAQPGYGEPSDEQLLANYRNGNRAAFARLVERYQRELFHFLVRFLGDRAAAEDIFQEAFL